MTTFSRVLIIDDDPVLRAMVSEFFQQRGASKVLQAADGLDALELIESTAPTIDLIVSDINMPRLDGVELIRRLKDVGYKGSIVIVSGTYDVVITMAQELASQLDLNIIGTIHKPFVASKLDEIIAAA